MSSFDSIKDYLASVEEYFQASLSVATYSLPDVHDVVNQLWIDISRYGPGLPAFPEVHIPTLGDFQLPPPPPPPPPSSTLLEKTTDWVERHPWRTTGITVGIVGAGLLVGYRDIFARRNQRHLHVSRKSQTTNERRQIVVVLGGDTVYALPLITELEKKGYIVIASVTTPEAGDVLESKCQGYVKALVLDPFHAASVPVFLRSLSATLSRKFPINAPGDPYASPSSLPYIHSIISLLTLSAPVPVVNAPLEHISLQETYLPYLTATQIIPLHVIQSLLPLLRTVSARSKDKGNKCIIVCLPATDALVGLPFASVQAMSAASTLRAVEVLRREVRIAAMSDKSESMKNINVVVVDVGSFNTGDIIDAYHPEDMYKSMENWTASEKVVYGPAFINVLGGRPATVSGMDRLKSLFSSHSTYGVRRRATDLSVFTNALVSVVSGGRYDTFGHVSGRIRNWIRGERFATGSGALTYKLASHLPTLFLDGLLNLPHFLISLRNRILPIEPYRRPPSELPPPVTDEQGASTSEGKGTSLPQELLPDIETNSDADVESNEGDTVDSSWVSLKKRTSGSEA